MKLSARNQSRGRQSPGPGIAAHNECERTALRVMSRAMTTVYQRIIGNAGGVRGSAPLTPLVRWQQAKPLSDSCPCSDETAALSALHAKRKRLAGGWLQRLETQPFSTFEAPRMEHLTGIGTFIAAPKDSHSAAKQRQGERWQRAFQVSARLTAFLISRCPATSWRPPLLRTPRYSRPSHSLWRNPRTSPRQARFFQRCRA